MAESKQGFHSLFSRLCEITFTSEAAKREDHYTRVFYTNSRRLKLQTCLYDTLFEELHAPWVGDRGKKSNCVKVKKFNKDEFDVYETLAVTAYKFRLERRFDEADELEYYSAKWKSLQSKLKSSIELCDSGGVICEPDAVIRFVAALAGSGPAQPSGVLGYQEKAWTSDLVHKDAKRNLPEGPLLNTDSHRLREHALLETHYVHYSTALFERAPSLGLGVTEHPAGLQTFDHMAGPSNGRMRFFALQEEVEDIHDKKTRKSLFSALAHGNTDDMQVKLSLPDLPSHPGNKKYGLSTLPAIESPDDEGFHEVTDSPSVLSSDKDQSIQSTQDAQTDLDVWSEAMKMKTQTFYTWEMEGRRDAAIERPYITEAGPAVFDELYNSLNRQVSYLVWTPTQYRMVAMRDVIQQSLNVLIGVPSTTFFLGQESLNFTVNETVRMSGCSPDLLCKTLSKLASIGTDYLHVSRFTSDEMQQSRGLVLQAFVGGLRSYLQCYRAAVLSVKASDVQSPLQLTFTFQSWAKQLRFLADMCMCSWSFRKHGGPKPKFPTGVKLLSYLYQLALEHSSSSLYPVLLSLLKHSCTPYIMFVQKWVFKGVCEDVFGEFIIEVDEQYLAYRDKHFWTHGFVMMGDEKLDCVPMFLSDLANDIFVCGKSINLLRLCSPEHYLCDVSVIPPKMEVTFSIKKLKSYDEICSHYVNAIEKVAQELKREREQRRMALEERAGRAVLEDKEQAEKALNEITGLIEKVKQAVEEKKREDLKMLKEQMEEAIKKRELEKVEKTEEERRYTAEALKREEAEDEIKEKARQDLIKYYEQLSEEIERREMRAQWQIKRHEHDDKRMRFLALERAKLEALQTQEKATMSVTPAAASQRTEIKQPTPSQATSSRTTPVTVPSPSIVSLIASGIKTDALVQAEAKRDFNKSSVSDGADSGVVSATTSRGATPALDTDGSEGHTLVSEPSFDQDDDTDISAASMIGGSASVEGGRKKWGRSEGVLDSLKQEDTSATSRKAWEAPDDGGVALAESLLPHGHPAESSIQFVLYGDKTTSLQAEETSETPETKQTQTNHPADSSLQNLLYPEPLSETPKDPSPADANLESVLIEVTTPPKSFRGHPSNSSAQSLIYENQVEEAASLKAPALAHGHPSDSSVQASIYEAPDNDQQGNDTSLSSADSVLQDFLQSISAGVPQAPRRGISVPQAPRRGISVPQAPRPTISHPSDSQAEGILYPSANQSFSPQSSRSRHGHPGESTAQDYLYQTTEHQQEPSHHPKSSYGHPSDSKLQGQENDLEAKTDLTHPRSLYGHPSDSIFKEEESGGSAESRHPRSSHGHPSDSTIKEDEYEGSAESRHPRSSHGHPSDSTIKEDEYEGSVESRHPRSSHGHPSDSTIKEEESRGSVESRHPRSSHGHPSDSQLDQNTTHDPDNSSQHQPRSQWGHPSNSTVQRTLEDIATLSESQQQVNKGIPPPGIMHPQTTRGTAPAGSAKGILYPGEEGAYQGHQEGMTTRGHEPAVTITKLMYPVGPDEGVKNERAAPLQFEDIWLASQVEPLRDNYDVLDKVPSTDLLRGALGGVVEERDEDESIDAAQLMSLPVLLQRSVTAPLHAQISMVNRAVVDYFIEELQVRRHFDMFRKFLFMEDGEFSLSLSDQLFDKLFSGVKPRELCSTTVMNGIITRALQLSVYADVTGLEQELSFALKWMPDMLKPNDIDALDFLELRCKVDWPVNIIITENSIIKYNKIFSFMLRLKRISWVLRNIWFHLKHIAFSRNAAGSPQLRRLQLFRHEMQHFVQNVEGYLSNQILNVTWAEFQQELANNVRNLDDLHHRHTEYLNKVIFRSLLSKKAAPVMKIIDDIFSLVLKFRAQLFSCPWQQTAAGSHVAHPSFSLMCSTHKAFKDYSGFLFTVVSKLVRRGYQSHLDDFLLRLNFNGYYNTS